MFGIFISYNQLFLFSICAMNDKITLEEIKKNKVGHGLLIENDGYITTTKELLRESANDGEWYVPYPFIVDAVFQKYGIKNANGRVYPEHILKREVERYQQRIKERRAYGECYTSSALILTKDGWQSIVDVTEGTIIPTLNTTTNEIEYKPISKKIAYEYRGSLYHIKGKNIDDVVTPYHKYPIYSKGKFEKFINAIDIVSNKEEANQDLFYIPKHAKANKVDNEYIVIGEKEYKVCDIAKIVGYYISFGLLGTNNEIIFETTNDKVIDEIAEIAAKLEISFGKALSENEPNKKIIIKDSILFEYLYSIGNNINCFIPKELKEQSADILKVLYDCIMLGNKNSLFINEKLRMDIDEISMKVLYKDENEINNLFIIKEEVPISEKDVKVEEEYYDGMVYCVDVENHTWYIQQNGKSHWTGNCNHPDSPAIDLGRISHNIIELHWEKSTLVGKMEIFTSYGFRTQGIVSTMGDIIANLILSGYKIGVSSRAVGSVESKLNTLIVGDDLELICWDCVGEPSTPGSYISQDSSNLQQYIEADDTKKNKPKLNEKIDKLKKCLLN